MNKKEREEDRDPTGRVEIIKAQKMANKKARMVEARAGSVRYKLALKSLNGKDERKIPIRIVLQKIRKHWVVDKEYW